MLGLFKKGNKNKVLPPTTAPVITIDGPSGSGKGTVSRCIAREFGWHLLDSGALYRLLACAALRDGVGLDDAAGLAELAGRIRGEFGFASDGAEIVRLDDEDVTGRLRTEATGNAASRLAALPEVRAALLDWQRRFRRPPGLGKQNPMEIGLLPCMGIISSRFQGGCHGR